MVVKDGQKWRRVSSRKIKGQWYSLDGDEELDNMPDIFITIDGRVPKNMSGKGTDEFELWPVKHNGNYRWTSRSRYHYPNSYGYYYSIKEYTYWDGILHSHTKYYHTDRQIEYLEKRMKAVAEAHHNPDAENGYTPPFYVADDKRFVKARY